MREVENRKVMEALAGKELPVCEYCGNRLTDEEIEYPPGAGPEEGELICEDCYHERYEFTCCWCQNYDLDEYQHVFLVLTEKVDDFKPGVYRIVAKPYYADGMIEGFILPHAIERVCAVPDGVDTEGYPAGHLCRECQTKIEKSLKAKSKRKRDSRK